MSEYHGELLDPSQTLGQTLAKIALQANEIAKQELAEYERTLNKALGAKPEPKTVDEREIEAATAETSGHSASRSMIGLAEASIRVRATSGLVCSRHSGQ